MKLDGEVGNHRRSGTGSDQLRRIEECVISKWMKGSREEEVANPAGAVKGGGQPVLERWRRWLYIVAETGRKEGDHP